MYKRMMKEEINRRKERWPTVFLDPKKLESLKDWLVSTGF